MSEDAASSGKKRQVNPFAQDDGEDIPERALHEAVQSLRSGDFSARRGAMQTLDQAGERAVPHLLAALDDAEAAFQDTAATWLVRIGKVGVPQLLIALDRGSPSARQVAAWALGQIGDARAIAPLIEALSDAEYNVQLAAAEALEAIGTLRAAEAASQWRSTYQQS